jgi:arylsulfatase A-like enzyme
MFKRGLIDDNSLLRSTNYYFPNASDPRKVTDLQTKILGDDSTFLVDQFEAFLERQIAAKRPWLAHICFHAIHEPHPAMPYFYHLYQKDPDYLGALTMWDTQVGRLMKLLKEQGVADDTAIFYTSGRHY